MVAEVLVIVVVVGSLRIVVPEEGGDWDVYCWRVSLVSVVERVEKK